jgi:hypothetical protein
MKVSGKMGENANGGSISVISEKTSGVSGRAPARRIALLNVDRSE